VFKHLQHSEILPIHTEHQALVVVFSGSLVAAVLKVILQKEQVVLDREEVDLTLVVVMENLDLRHHPDLEIMEPLTQEVVEEDLDLLLAVMVDRVLLWLHILPNK
tara:strand:- start:158 stop:472 length:315 start_codon:yes stop_codon:yes gene_type:complete